MAAALPEKIAFFASEFIKSTSSPRKKWLCVQVAIRPDVVGVRDSKDAGKTTLVFSREEWIAFIEGAKRGEFDVR